MPKRRSFAPKPTEGPSLGAFVNADETVTVRPVAKGERPTLPGATVRATDDSREAVTRAAEICRERIRRYATRPVVVTISV